MTEDVNVYVPGVKHVEVEFISWFTTWNKKIILASKRLSSIP